MGGGAAFFDYDNDGWLDIFLVNGTQLRSDGPRRASPTSYLFHNNRDGTFTDVTAKAGPDPFRLGPGAAASATTTTTASTICSSATGAGTCSTTTTATARSPTSRNRPAWPGPAAAWGAGCCFLDYDRDGHLDLFVANYVNFDPAKAPRPGDSAYCRYNEIPVPCGPLGFAGGTNVLYRNRGDGTFADVSEASGIAQPARALVDGVRRAATGGRRARTAWARRRRISTTTAGPTSTSRATPRRACSTATTTTARSARSRCRRAAPSTRTASRWRAWASASATTTATAGSTSSGPTSREQVTTLYRNYGGAFEDASIRAGLGVNRKYVGFGVGLLRLRQRRLEGHLHRERPRLLADRRSRSCTSPTGSRRSLYRNLGNGRFEDVSATGGRRPSAPRISAAAAPSATSTTTATSTWSSTTWTARRRCCATTAGTRTTGS